jgi:hypothetical protein
MNVTKEITIKQFMELWENVLKGKWDDISPDLGKQIRKIWGDEIMMRFDESKGGGSYGGYGDSSSLALLLRNDSGPGGRVSYNAEYSKRYGGKTFYKTGDLEEKMQQEVGQGSPTFDNNGRLMTRINIPEMTNEPFGPNVQWNWEYCYAHLEEWRSFIRSSLLIAWPAILKHVINSIV